METLREFSDVVEVVGLDEAYVDLSGSPVPQSRAREIKRRIKEATHLVCSIGLAPNKLMAKIASDLDKPDGLCVLDHESWLPRVGEKPATILPGVGPKTFERLRGDRDRDRRASSPPPTPRRCERAFGPKHGDRPARPRATAVGSDRPDHRAQAQVGEPRDDLPRRRHRPRRSSLETVERLAALGLREPRASTSNAGRTVTLKIRPAALQDLHALEDAGLPHPRRRHGRRRWPASCWSASTRRTRSG